MWPDGRSRNIAFRNSRSKPGSPILTSLISLFSRIAHPAFPQWRCNRFACVPQTAHYFDHEDLVMPKGNKSSYTDKQKREAKHIEKSEEDKGKSKKTAERIAYATVNKQDGGGKNK